MHPAVVTAACIYFNEVKWLIMSNNGHQLHGYSLDNITKQKGSQITALVAGYFHQQLFVTDNGGPNGPEV